MRKKIVVLISGSGTNLQAIIDGCESGDINGDVVAVVANKADAYGLQRAEKHNIPAITICHNDFEKRALFDQALAQHIHKFSPDLIVLAGFMRVLTPKFVQQFKDKVLNIHPSLLPKYPGLNTHQKVLDNQDSIHGASVHFVSDELDGGPVVLQSVIKVFTNDSVEALTRRIAITEWKIYTLVVKWYCLGALKMHQDLVWLDKDAININAITRKEKCLDELGNEFECELVVRNAQKNENNKEAH